MTKPAGSQSPEGNEAGSDIDRTRRHHCRTTDEASAHDHVMSSIEARRGEVLVGIMDLEAIQRIEMVLCPLPSITHGVVVATGGCRK